MSRYLIFISWYSLLLTINSYTYIVERQPSGDVIYGIDCIHYNAVKYGNGCKCSNNGTFYYDFYITQCIKGPGSYWLDINVKFSETKSVLFVPFSKLKNKWFLPVDKYLEFISTNYPAQCTLAPEKHIFKAAHNAWYEWKVNSYFWLEKNNQSFYKLMVDYNNNFNFSGGLINFQFICLDDTYLDLLVKFEGKRKHFTRSHPIATMRTPASKNMDGYFTISRVETGDIYSANSCDRYNAKMVSVSKCQCKDRGTFFLNVSIQRCYNMEETNRIYNNHFLLLQNVYTIYQSYKDGNGNWNIPKIPLVYEHNTTLKSEDCPSPSNGTFYYYSDFKWIKDIPHVYVVYDNKNDYFFLQKKTDQLPTYDFSGMLVEGALACRQPDGTVIQWIYMVKFAGEISYRYQFGTTTTTSYQPKSTEHITGATKTPTTGYRHNSDTASIIIGSLMGGVGLILIAVAFLYFDYIRRTKLKESEAANVLSNVNAGRLESSEIPYLPGNTYLQPQLNKEVIELAEKIIHAQFQKNRPDVLPQLTIPEFRPPVPSSPRPRVGPLSLNEEAVQSEIPTDGNIYLSPVTYKENSDMYLNFDTDNDRQAIYQVIEKEYEDI